MPQVHLQLIGHGGQVRDAARAGAVQRGRQGQDAQEGGAVQDHVRRVREVSLRPRQVRSTRQGARLLAGGEILSK